MKAFQHDCNECIYLGTFTDDEEKTVDMYAHPNEDEITILARYGNEDSEYISTPMSLAILRGDILSVATLLWIMKLGQKKG